MRAFQSGTRRLRLAGGLLAVLLSASSALAQSPTVLFYEDFYDGALAGGSTLFMNLDSTAFVQNGVAKIDDRLDRSGFSVVKNFDEPLMTFQFDFVETVVPIPHPELPADRMEVILRAGIGTAALTLQSTDDVVESIYLPRNGCAGESHQPARGAEISP